MANLQCNSATDITTQTAGISGSGDNIPANHFLRTAFGITPGGPYTGTGNDAAGTNATGQTVTDTLIGLASSSTVGATYYYVVQELDADGVTVLDQSVECSFTTLPYNPRCRIISVDGDSATVEVCADFVAGPQQRLQAVYSFNPGGPYDNIGGDVAGTFVENQCQVFDVPLDPCVPVYFKARVTPTPAEYEVDWQYAHMNRISGQDETVTLRLGDEVEYPANQVVVDVDTQDTNGTWHLRQGTFPVPSGVTQLHMGFTGTGGQPNLGNYLDSCSIILRQVFPGSFTIGEQLLNGSFEFPDMAGQPQITAVCQVPPNDHGFIMFPEEPTTAGIAWQTTAPDGLIEFWEGPSDFDCSNGQGNLPLVAHTGKQWAELSANFESELFQVVNLAVGTADSVLECPAAVFLIECTAASDIDCDSAILNGEQCGLLEDFWYAFEVSESPAGPWIRRTPLVQSLTPLPAPPSPFSASLGALDPNTTYFYRVVVLNPEQEVIAVSDPVCSFTTDDCVYYCGMLFDPDTCQLVDQGNGTSYLYCFQF